MPFGKSKESIAKEALLEELAVGEFSIIKRIKERMGEKIEELSFDLNTPTMDVGEIVEFVLEGEDFESREIAARVLARFVYQALSTSDRGFKEDTNLILDKFCHLHFGQRYDEKIAAIFGIMKTFILCTDFEEINQHYAGLGVGRA